MDSHARLVDTPVAYDAFRAFAALRLCGSKVIRNRVPVALASRSSTAVDGRTRPPSIRAMYDCDVFMRAASSACDKPARLRVSISTRANWNSSSRAL